MADFTFSDDVAEELHDLARRKGRSVEDVVREMIRQYKSTEVTEKPDEDADAPPGSVAAFVKAALAADIHLEEDDLALRSREILDTEFTEYLRRRLDEVTDADNA